MEQATNKYPTTDIKIGAYLLSRSIPLIGVDRTGPKVTFEFSKTSQIKKFIQEYLADNALVNPRVLFESFDRLKGLIHRDYEI